MEGLDELSYLCFTILLLLDQPQHKEIFPLNDRCQGGGGVLGSTTALEDVLCPVPMPVNIDCPAMLNSYDRPALYQMTAKRGVASLGGRYQWQAMSSGGTPTHAAVLRRPSNKT